MGGPPGPRGSPWTPTKADRASARANLFQIFLQIRVQLQLNGGIVQIVAID